MPASITLFKFVGTISLGLLTGVSYTLSTQSLPSLLTLPSAKPAAHTLAQSTRLATLHIRALAGLATASFLTAFALSPARIRHPYLLWTAAVAGLSGALVENKFLVSRRVPAAGTKKDVRVQAGKKNASVTEEVDEAEWEKVGGVEMNGEQVEQKTRERQLVEFVRTGVAGLAFAMSVVGIWGEGA